MMALTGGGGLVVLDCVAEAENQEADQEERSNVGDHFAN